MVSVEGNSNSSNFNKGLLFVLVSKKSPPFD